MAEKTFLLRVFGPDFKPEIARVTIDAQKAERYLRMSSAAARLALDFDTAAYVKALDYEPDWYEGFPPDKYELEDMLDQEECIECNLSFDGEDPMKVEAVYVNADDEGIFWSGILGDLRVETASIAVLELGEIAKEVG